jgi:ABC-type branched-subunit amino acid transport system ATPase component
MTLERTQERPRAQPGEAAIHVEGLVKHFGDVHALDGVDLDAQPGTVLGLLGPNGAGKTTAVRVLATLIKADAAPGASPNSTSSTTRPPYASGSGWPGSTPRSTRT